MTNFNLDAFVADLESLRSEVEQTLSKVSDVESLETARVAFLGAKNGRLKAIQKGLSKLGREDKPAGGKQFNAIKKTVESLFSQTSVRMESPSKGAKAIEQIDETLDSALHQRYPDDTHDLVKRFAAVACDAP